MRASRSSDTSFTSSSAARRSLTKFKVLFQTSVIFDSPPPTLLLQALLYLLIKSEAPPAPTLQKRAVLSRSPGLTDELLGVKNVVTLKTQASEAHVPTAALRCDTAAEVRNCQKNPETLSLPHRRLIASLFLSRDAFKCFCAQFREQLR